MTTFSKSLSLAAAAISLAAPAVVLASPAAAAGRDGTCAAGEFCYYYNSGEAGSVSDFTGSVADYGATQPGCYDFKGAGAGKGVCVKNNAASVWNRTSKTVRVFFNSNYTGSHQDFAAGARGNLYATSGGRITCGFDGYTSTPGRHEGIDIARSVGSPVHALVSGTVIYVARGATGSSGLSTISVYNSSLNKTVIYLHSAPGSGVSVGDPISRGQVIATESWHGVSSASGAHTHVEMRLGRQTHAAKSVSDPVLDNPNPTSFWNSQGYNIK
jgi:murein DD-endopeptidase MepM/ murein hydrolase activator NlpD